MFFTLGTSSNFLFFRWKYLLETSVDIKRMLSDIVVIISTVKGKLPILDQPLWDFIVMIEQCHRNSEECDFRSTVLRVQGLYRLLQGCSGIATDREV